MKSPSIIPIVWQWLAYFAFVGSNISMAQLSTAMSCTVITKTRNNSKYDNPLTCLLSSMCSRLILR